MQTLARFDRWPILFPQQKLNKNGRTYVVANVKIEVRVE